MKPTATVTRLPKLYVEGDDDLYVIGSLLSVNGVDTNGGQEHLFIQPSGGDRSLISQMPTLLKADADSTRLPIGFVLDTDTMLADRWRAIRDALAGLDRTEPLPESMPAEGFIGVSYLRPFGVYLMPDCQSDKKKLEDFVATLVPPGHPLWPHAQRSTEEAKALVRDANKIAATKWPEFSDADTIKAEVRAFLAWQKEPGNNMGHAITKQALRPGSETATRFLRWLQRLYPDLPLTLAPQ